MNINLITNTNENPTPEGYENVLINDIDKIPANICTNLVLNDTLNYLTNNQFQLLLGKIRHGGTIAIASPDAMEMAKALYWGQINLEKFSSLIIDNKSQHSLVEIKNFFEQSGYIIEAASINEFSFFIKAKRP